MTAQKQGTGIAVVLNRPAQEKVTLSASDGNEVGLRLLSVFVTGRIAGNDLVVSQTSFCGELNQGVIVIETAEKIAALESVKATLADVGIIVNAQLYYWCQSELIWRGWYPEGTGSFDVWKFAKECIARRGEFAAAYREGKRKAV